MTYPVVQLGAVTCLGTSPTAWAFRDGVEPASQEYDLRPEDADQLLRGRAQPIVLRIEGAGEVLSVDRLYVVEELPADNPNLRRVRVVDRRYWWQYATVLRRYNIRRRGPNQRVKITGTKELEPLIETIEYAPWSTYDGDGQSPWTAQQVLEDVLNRVVAKEDALNGQGADITIDRGSLGGITDLPVEDLRIDASGPSAVAQALAQVPEAGITVDADGIVRVYSRVSGREVTPIQQSGPESVGKGHVVLATNERTRPSSVRVFFSREIEIRFDFKELASKSSSVAPKKDARSLDNVLPLPDYELTVGKRTLQQGTYMTIPDALTAWGPIPSYGPIDFEFLRQAMVPYVDLWTAARGYGTFVPDVDWTARLAALARHYRQTFRIPRRWMDRLESIRAYRVAIVDQATASRAPSVAYANYSLIPSGRRVESGAMDTGVANVDGYPTGSGDPPALTAESRPAPATVTVPDSDQGIIRVDYLTDTVGMIDVTLPGRILNAESRRPGPSKRLRDADRVPVMFDAMPDLAAGDVPELESEHRTAVIVTGVAGAPNDLRQCHMIEVEPGQIKDMLPPGMRAGIGTENAYGPPLDVRVIPSPQTTALVAWSDDYATQIEQAFGLSGEPDESPDLSRITINRETLQDVANAYAAGIYASFADRYQGSKTVRMQPRIALDGWLAEIWHGVGIKGEVETRLSLRGAGEIIDPYGLMHPSTRALLMRQAQPGGQA